MKIRTLSQIAGLTVDGKCTVHRRVEPGTGYTLGKTPAATVKIVEDD